MTRKVSKSRRSIKRTSKGSRKSQSSKSNSRSSKSRSRSLSRKRNSRKFGKKLRKFQKGGMELESPRSSIGSNASNVSNDGSYTPSNSSGSSIGSPTEWPQLDPNNLQQIQEAFNEQLLDHFKIQDQHHNVYFSSNENLFQFFDKASTMPNKLKNARNVIDSFFKSDVKKVKISFIDNNYQDLITLMKEKTRFQVDYDFNSVLSYFIKLLLGQPFQHLEKIESNKLVANRSNLYIISTFIIAYLIIKHEKPEFDPDNEIKLLLVPKEDDYFHFLAN